MEELEDLLNLVDAEIELLHGKLTLMEQMAQCVQKGELDRLKDLLEQDTRFEERGAQAESRRQQMRQRIAASLALPLEEVTLGRLAGRFGGPVAIALNDRREKLLLLVGRIRREAAITTRLVKHALDFNDRLLAAMAGAEAEGDTYCADGEVEHGRQGAIFQHSA